jgi:hypothetical protein
MVEDVPLAETVGVEEGTLDVVVFVTELPVKKDLTLAA